MDTEAEVKESEHRVESLVEQFLTTYEELNLFYVVSEAMRSFSDSEKMLDFILDKALEAVKADKVALLMMDESKNRLEARKTGTSVSGRGTDSLHEIDCRGPLLSKLVDSRKGLIVNDAVKFDGEIGPLIATRSLLGAPLCGRDRVIGVLMLGDKNSGGFTASDLKLSLVLSGQAALIIENDRLLQQNATLAEIGRIMGSSLNIGEVYECFVREAHKLIPFERIHINLFNHEEKTATVAYSAGIELPGREVGTVFSLEGTAAAEVIRTGSSLVLHVEDRADLEKRFSGLIPSLEAGHRSIIITPIFSKDKVIGDLYFASTATHRYGDRHGRLAESIGTQIAGAIANGQLFMKQKQIEEEKSSIEAQLHQSQKMEAIGQLAGGIAHDFNNLLTVINGYSEFALSSLSPNDSLREEIEEIRKAGVRAAGLTRQLLTFSRRQVPEFKVLDVGGIVRDLEKMLCRTIGENIELTIKLQENLGRVKADVGQIEQVMMNLAINARDAMPNGGKLIIELAGEELDETYVRKHAGVEPGKYVMISVSDTGEGMAPEIREKIFEPFFTTKETGKGTGLGLSTVYGIVKQSGGHIWVYSEKGHGTVFKIYLPEVEGEADQPVEKAREEETPPGEGKILVVEDEPSVRELTAEFLRKQGYTVLEAQHGNEALRTSREHEGPIDLLVTDVVMPGMTGRELVERLSLTRPGMKVLYMSGYADDAVIQQGVLEEGVNYIQKPFSIGKFAHKVREVLNKGRQKHTFKLRTS